MVELIIKNESHCTPQIDKLIVDKYPISFTHRTSNHYLGCFIDQIGNRDLNIFISDYELLTPQQCILACQEQNFPYAGIQHGNECRCGRQYGKYGRVSDDECIYNCLTSEKCGGHNRNSIYSVFNSIDTYSSTCQNNLIGYQGCFDSITLKIGMGIAYSIEECIKRCSIKYSYAGIMNGNLCHCGNDLNQPLSNSNLCNIQCYKSSTDMTIGCCGGLRVLSVYNIKNYQSLSRKDLSETMIRVNESTYSSSYTIAASSTSTIITSIPMNNSISLYTASVVAVTSQPLITTSSSLLILSLLNSTITNNSSTSMSQSVSFTTSNMHNIYTSVYSSLMMSNVTSTTPISSTNTVKTLITTSHLNTSIIPTLTDTSTLVVISRIANMSQSSTNPITTAMSLFGNNSISAVKSNTDVTTQITVTTQSSVTNASNLSIAISQTVNSTLSTTTISILPRATIDASFLMSTIIIAPLNQNFTPTDNNTRQSIRQGLIRTINFAFNCLTNSTYPNCTQPRQRIKRQICSNGYDVNLLPDITEISNSTPSKYKVDYSVSDLCNSGALLSAIQVKTATDRLLPQQIIDTLGYNYDGELIRSTTNDSGQTSPTDRKLWLIGAILGPIGFVLLLIFVFCYLHYKCRPRPKNRALTKPVNNAPPVSARSTNYKTMSNESITEKPTSEKTIHALIQNDPLVGTGTSSRRLTPSESEKSSTHTPRHSVSADIPLDEIRRQNDVERWRNKLRLQEKFQQSPIKFQDSSVPNTNRSSLSQYDNQAFEHDIPKINIQPADNIVSTHSPRHIPQTTESEVGRTKLHRLLDEVLDKADSEKSYNPDSESERQKRRRQRRRINSVSDDHKILPLYDKNQQISHIPVIPQVSQRPDPSIIRLYYDPYEAGDRAHDIARFTPVELIPKYSIDDQQNNQYSSRSNPPLFFDDSIIADRAATATDAYATPKRLAKTRIETDREAMMRHDNGRIDQRQHKFKDDPAYIDKISKDRDGYRTQARNGWMESEINNDPLRRNDYRDEYLTAKQSVLNTKNIISSIHNELQHITSRSSGDYHA
ncbi:unnamed protein product [Rotaria sordida]|uniref:WSC domain-containing protein n=1 Tax=Rotaria sordida TaxID=392033 RepID=A0A814XKG9_9BILA|nr:unnamed protein product [Rotaria sordida]